MTVPVKPPILPNPPKEYDQQYMMRLLNQLTLYINAANSTGDIECSAIVATKLPTSAVGLRAGTFYNDNGTVKVVL
jgi:hypothetical protein